MTQNWTSIHGIKKSLDDTPGSCLRSNRSIDGWLCDLDCSARPGRQRSSALAKRSDINLEDALRAYLVAWRAQRTTA